MKRNEETPTYLCRAADSMTLMAGQISYLISTSAVFASSITILASLRAIWGVDSERLVDESAFEFLILVSSLSSSLGESWEGTVVRRDVVDVRLIGDCIEGPESDETPVTMGSEGLDAPGTWAFWAVFSRQFALYSVVGGRGFTLSMPSSSMNKP